MNRFHSSGTASGNVEVMWTWKMIMPTTAIVHSVPPRETSSMSGSENSIDGAEVRGEGRPARGPQILRIVRGRAGAWPRASGSTACC